MTYRKKLIEVALPLEEINAASAREKSIRHGHPSTLHLWWARRPLATCRAVLFSSIIDDPGEEGVPQEMLDEIDKLPLHHKYRNLAHEEPLDKNGKPLSADDAAKEKLARQRRYRLFTFIERLVQWENSNDPDTLEVARSLIHAATGGNPPPVLDPFCGGGSIPLEAQRLGLEAHGSDLNPVAVLITKAMIEIPPKFADQPPVNPAWQAESPEKKLLKSWRGAEGLAEDVRYYGQWMRDEAERRIGHLYPKVKVTAEMAADRPDLKPLIGEELTVIAWLWARTVPSPDPAARGAQVPLVKSFVLSSKRGKEAWIEPDVNNVEGTFKFVARVGALPDRAKSGTKLSRGANFRCLLTNTTIEPVWIKAQSMEGRLGQCLLGIVAEGKRGRVYLSPSEEQENVALLCSASWRPRTPIGGDKRALWTPLYGLTTFGDLYTDRQLVALTTLSDLVGEARARVRTETLASGFDESQSITYANAVGTYLALGVSRLSDIQNSLCRWEVTKTQVRNLFSRQAIPMVWDFAENNVFAGAAGDYSVSLDNLLKALRRLPASIDGEAQQIDATRQTAQPYLFSTDPPYFDNIGYSDLSDFFYVWLRRSLGDVYPLLFSTVVTPKTDELIATPYRHEGSKEKATKFFEAGLRQVFTRMRDQGLPDFPTTIYYAFKQSETEDSDEEGQGTETASTGWETMLQGLVDSGFAINGTWPTRTELGNRMIASGTNALASCIVLVCRQRGDGAESIHRRQFLSLLRQELKPALIKLTQGNVAPVDLAQAAIGPGMAVFSRYKAILEADGSPMRVRTALTLINQALDEALEEQEGWYDPETRWAVTWFTQRGFSDGPSGEAILLSTAKDTALNAMERAGFIKAIGGKVKLLDREELAADYDPESDPRTTIWEATQYLVRELETHGEVGAARMMRRYRETKADLDVERARELAYRLYAICDQKRWTNEARGYNALVLSWSDIEAVSQKDEAKWETQPEPRPRGKRNENTTLDGIEAD